MATILQRCSLAENAAAPSLNAYVQSIQSICVHVGMPIPQATSGCHFVPYNGNAHIVGPGGEVGSLAACQQRLSDGYGDQCIFLHSERSTAWRDFITATPPLKRHEASVRRIVTLVVYTAMRRHRCIYCWLPLQMCMCASLEALRNEVCNLVLPFAEATMLLHCEELLRSTNTGHIAAFILGSRVRVWGIPEDDAWLQHVGEPGASPTSRYVLLYPEDGCALITDVFVDAHHHQPVGEAADCVTPAQSADGAAVTASSSTAGPSPKVVVDHPKLHLILSDGTWGQAHRVNRHVPRSIPRVALRIPDAYESLFASLRKQTRATGVSTLEATAMAITQRMVAAGATAGAAAVEGALVVAMKRFVDAVCITKNQDAAFAAPEEAETVHALKERRREHHVQMMASERSAGKRLNNPEHAVAPDEFRRLLAPPVLSYCYVCDMFVGWSRMGGHVLGAKHRSLLASKGDDAWTPSARSALPSSANLHVQNGNPVPLARLADDMHQ